jgi:histidine ammonia-lyase
MGLALTGRGEVYYKNKKLKAIEAFKLAGLQPIILGPKDGLILCSNNSASLGHAAILIDRYASVLDHANLAYALSLEAFRGNINPLHPKLNEFRPHKGQTCTTEDILCYLEDSYLWEEDVKRGVQDPISFRSSVQVHGACKDIYNFVLDGINIEINSIGDNPLLLSTENKLISHGNFHIGTIAMRFDFLAIQSSSLANMIQNRIQRIMTPEFSGLPIFLTENPGLSNGFSTLQKSYTYFAAEIRHLANPGSLDALNVANSVEDHAAMTAFVVQKMEQIIENLERIIGIELMVASQAIDILNNPKLGKGTEVAYRNLRSYIPKLEEDRQLRQDIEIAHQLIKKRVILNEVGKLKKGIKLNPNF